VAQEQFYTVKTKRRKIKTGRILFLLVLCLFLATVLFSVRFINVLNSLQDTSPWTTLLPVPNDGEREHAILYTVSDREGDGLITELSLAAYHPQKKDIRVIHIPTDTLIDVEGHGFIHIDQVYSVGGPQLTLQSITTLLGVPIHYFIEINEDFLPTAIDRVNGVSLPSEITLVNGSDLLSLLHEEGLTASQSLERRRHVLTAVASSVMQSNALQKLKYLSSLSPLVSTNLSWRKLLSTMDSLKNVEFKDSTRVIPLPGTEEIQTNGRYWLVDTSQIPLLVAWLDDDITGMPRAQITVEVLNGCGIKGIATEVADMLTAEGFKVLKIGNADRYDYDVSRVISRTDNVDGAKEIAVLIPGAQLLKEELESEAVVTVIIGKNYKQQE
jgi:anionic cell wall polymer biosynthesis LytR-Cps2A-Psr (LCP) family protein